MEDRVEQDVHSVLNPQSSIPILYPLSSVLSPQSSVLSPQSSILYPLSSILYPLSSVLISGSTRSITLECVCSTAPPASTTRILDGCSLAIFRYPSLIRS
jgi:hypothetical protein